MEAARAGQKSITGTGADLRKLGMHEARLRLLEMSREMNLGLDDDTISSDFLITKKSNLCAVYACALHSPINLRQFLDESGIIQWALIRWNA